MAFYTIHAAPALPPRDRERARRHGPRFVNARSDYVSMLQAAGFARIAARDVTREFERIQVRWLRARERHREAIIAAVGEERHRELCSDGRLSLRAIQLGLLRRSLFVATA
jgi:hypothetical protein